MCSSRAACLSMLLIYLLASSIAFLVLISFGYNKTTEHDRYFKDIEQNQQSTGFTDIKVQQYPCSNGYKNIVNYEAPGVKGYCRYMGGRYQEGRCHEKSYHDREYYGQGPIPLEILNGLYYCGKENTISFNELRSQEQNSSCPSKYKLCGKDSKENLCYPDQATCPINDILITHNQQTSLVNNGYQEQKQTDSYGQQLYVYTTNKMTNKSIPVEFKFGFQQMCVDPNEEVVPKPQMRFFDKDYENECDAKLGKYKVDDRYEQLTTVNKLRMFQENGVDRALKNKYDLYDSHDVNYDVTLFQRPNLHFTDECRKYFYGNNNSNGFKKMDSKQISHFFGFLIFFYVAFILVALISCCLLCANASAPKNQKTYCVAVTILMIFVMIAFGMIIHIYQQSIQRNEKVIKVEDMDCGDNIFNSLMSDASIHSKKSNARFFVCLILVSIAVFLYVLYLCIFYCKKKDKKSNKSSFKSYDKVNHSQKHNTSTSSSSSSSSDSDKEDNFDHEYQNIDYQQYNNNPYHYDEDRQNQNTEFYN